MNNSIDSKVIIANAGVLGITSLTDIELILKIALLTLTICYTGYKFFLTYKNRKDVEENE